MQGWKGTERQVGRHRNSAFERYRSACYQSHRYHIGRVEKLKTDAEESAGSIPQADYVLRYNALAQKVKKLTNWNEKFGINESLEKMKCKLDADDDDIAVGNIEGIIPAVHIKVIYNLPRYGHSDILMYT